MHVTLFAQSKTILADALSFFIQNFSQIVAICMPFLLATSAANFMSDADELSPMALLAPMVVNILVYPIYTAALIHLMALRARQKEPRSIDLIMAAIQQWAPLLILKIIMVFLIGLGMSLLFLSDVWIGLRLVLALPGIWIAVRLVFAEFYLVLFGMNPMDAILRSFKSTQKQFTLLLILLMVTYVPILVLGLTTDHLVQVLTSNDLFRALINSAWSLIGLIVHVVLFRAFMQVISEQRAGVLQ